MKTYKTYKKKPKFRRNDWYKQPKLGQGKKVYKIVWRRPKGRHSKLRQRWKGNAGKRPSVGYGNVKENWGKVQNMSPIMIFNINDLTRMKKEEIGIIGSSVGDLKKEEIAKKALELGKKFTNFNPQQFIEKLAKEREERRKEKEKKMTEKQKKEEEKKRNAEKHEKESKQEKEKEKEGEIEKEKSDEEKMIKHEIAKPKHDMAQPHKEVIHRLTLEK